MADNNLSAGSVAGTGKDGRVTKGDVLAAVASGASSIPTGAPTSALPRRNSSANSVSFHWLTSSWTPARLASARNSSRNRSASE